MVHVVERPSKYSKEYLNKLFQYTLGEDIANSVTHIIGSFFALYALVHLTWVAARYGNNLDALAFIFYGFTLLIMFVMSAVYHAMLNHTARSVMKKLDHISIYWLILGTYTPYIFCLLRSKDATVIFISLLCLTILGTVFKAFIAGKYRVVSTLIYVIMGWAILFILPELVHKLSVGGLWFLAIGGVCYTLGALLYAFAKFKYSHMVWHIFVILGAVFQYISVNFFILQYRV